MTTRLVQLERRVAYRQRVCRNCEHNTGFRFADVGERVESLSQCDAAACPNKTVSLVKGWCPRGLFR